LNPYQKLGAQTIVYGMGNVIPRLLNYGILTVYYTRRFAVEEYGIITELYAYVAILLVILTFGMETGLFKFSTSTNKDPIVFSTTFFSISASSALFILVVILLRNAIAQKIGYSGNPEYIAILSCILGIDAICAIVFAKLRIENKVRRFAMLKIFNVAATIVLVLFFLEILPRMEVITKMKFYREHLLSIGVGYVFIANLIASFLVCMLLLKELKGYRLKVDLSLLGRMLFYSLPLMVAGLAGMFNESIDRIMLRKYLPEHVNPLYELGIYGANYRIAVIMTIFVQMFRYAAEPFFFNKYRQQDSREMYANVLKYFTIFLMFIFLTITLFIDWFKYFIDKDYFEGLKIVPVVLMANVILGILFNVNMWYKLTGQTAYGIYITGTGAIITVGLNILLIPVFSYVGCAWIHLTSNFIMLCITYYFGQMKFKINYDLWKILQYVGFAIVIYLISLVVKTKYEIANLLIGAIFILAYLYYCNKRENLIKIFAGKYDSTNHK
jgi:O-antigen/teichoic acid export membrane protein